MPSLDTDYNAKAMPTKPTNDLSQAVEIHWPFLEQCGGFYWACLAVKASSAVFTPD